MGAGNSAEAVLDIRTDSTSFFADVDKAEKKATSLAGVFDSLGKFITGFGNGVNQTGKELEKATSSADAFGVSFGKLVASWVTAEAVVGLVKEGVEAIAGELERSVEAAGKAEKAHAQVAAALRQQGTAVPSVIDAYQRYAEELEKTSTFQDKVIESAEGILVTVGNVMPRDMKAALQATMDLAAGLGKDLPEAALLVSKAAEGNITALRKAGITVDETKAKAQGFGYVLDQIEAKFGGQAAAVAGTYQGRIAQLGNAWDHVEESIGRAITTNATVIDLLQRVTALLDGNTTELNTNKAAVDLVSASVILLVRAVGVLAVSLDVAQTMFEALVLAIRAGAQGIGQTIVSLLKILAAVGQAGGDVHAWEDLAPAINAVSGAVTELGNRNQGTVERSNALGNGLQRIAGAANTLAAQLETTRGKTVELGKAADESGDAWNRHTTGIVQGSKAIENLENAIRDLDLKLSPLPGHFTLISDQAKVYGAEAMKLVEEADAIGLAVPASLRRVASAWNDTEIQKVVEHLTAKWFADLDKFNAEGEKKLEAGADAMAKAIIKNDAIIRQTRRETQDLIDKRTLTSFELQRTQVDQWVQAQKAAVDTTSGNYVTAFNEIDEKAKEMFRDIADAQSQFDMANAVKAAADEAEKGFRGSFSKIAQSIPGLLQQGVLGGGGLKGAGQAIGIALGTAIGNELATGRAGQLIAHGLAQLFHVQGAQAAGELATLVQGLFATVAALAGSGVLGQAAQFGTLGAGIGAGLTHGSLTGGLIGAGVGAAIGALIGWIQELKQKNEEAKAAFDDLLKAAGGSMDLLIAKARTAGVALATVSDAADGDMAAIKQLQDALNFQDQAMKDLDTTIAKYHFSIEELGPAMRRQNLDKQAQEIYHDWMVLAAAGIDVAAIAREMGANIQDFVNGAIAAGADVPEALRPILQKMVDLGELTDAAGNKITDLNQLGLHWTLSMSDGFKLLIAAVDRLTAAIARALGITIDLGDSLGNLPAPPSSPPGQPPPNTQEAAGDYVRLMRPHTFTAGEAGSEDVVFGGAGRNLARDVAVELARLLPTPSAEHAGAVGPSTVQLVVDNRVLGEVVVEGIGQGGPGHSKFKTLVRRSMH